ncbi:FkbM family methyltransferase [Parvibaculum sp.]|uniref:FkbM family methyltransferase n=1 Tax=Parvibaculum sp. TaxID=2024848 RepID=UPI003BA882A2
MSKLPYYARRVLSEAWSRATPRYRVRAGSRSLSIPGGTPAGARLLRDWSPNWKTSVIGHFLGRRSGAFIDIGTNIGQTLLDFYEAKGPQSRYIGFEPNPSCVEMMNAIISGNRLEDATMVPVGLSGRDGLMKIYVGNTDPTDQGGTFMESLRPAKQLNSFWVPCFRFDAVLEDLGMGAGDLAFIKIDVEGAELHVLEGMKETLAAGQVPVLCEVLHRDPQADEAAYRERVTAIAELVRAQDYRIHRILRSAAQKIEGLEEVADFPQKVWDATSGRECDYLFLPAGYETPF